MTMRSGEQEAKKNAHEYLEQFQKSVRRNLLPTLRLSYSLDLSLLTVIAFVEGLLGDRHWNPPIQGRARGDSFCRHHASRKGY